MNDLVHDHGATFGLCPLGDGNNGIGVVGFTSFDAAGTDRGALASSADALVQTMFLEMRDAGELND